MSIGVFIVIILICGALLWLAINQIPFPDGRIRVWLRVLLCVVGAIWILERSGLTNLF